MLAAHVHTFQLAFYISVLTFDAVSDNQCYSQIQHVLSKFVIRAAGKSAICRAIIQDLTEIAASTSSIGVCRSG